MVHFYHDWRLHNLIVLKASLNSTNLNFYHDSWEVVLLLRKNSRSGTVPPTLSGIAYFHKIQGHPDPFQTFLFNSFHKPAPESLTRRQTSVDPFLNAYSFL